MITGHGDVSMAVKAMRAGALDFIEKPFGHEELLASITQALEQAPGSARSDDRRMAAASQLNGLTTRQRQIWVSFLPVIPVKTLRRIWALANAPSRIIGLRSCKRPVRVPFPR
jgi:FixJ family two-component response regulator